MRKKNENSEDDGGINIKDNTVIKSKKEIERKLKYTIEKLNKKYGEKTGSEIDFASNYYKETVPISTGFVGVDNASGIGGIPSSGIVEIYGGESIGKSYLAQSIIASVQKKDPRYAVYADLEGGLEIKRMKNIGIKVEELIRLDFDIAENIFEEIKELISSGTVSAVVVDSVAALYPKMEAEANYEDPLYAAKARILSRILPEMAMLTSRYNVVVIFINQLRVKLGAYNTPEETPGGRSLKYFAQMRIECKYFYDKEGQGAVPTKIFSPDGKLQIGQRVNVKFIKNKFAPPFREGMFELYFAESDMIRGVIFSAKKEKLWFVRNGVYNYDALNGVRLSGNGEEMFLEQLIKSDAILEIVNRLLALEIQKKTKLFPDKFTKEEFETEIIKRKTEIFNKIEDSEVPSVPSTLTEL